MFSSQEFLRQNVISGRQVAVRVFCDVSREIWLDLIPYRVLTGLYSYFNTSPSTQSALRVVTVP